MQNLTALITGASKGIGLEIAKRLADDLRFTTIHCVARTMTPIQRSQKIQLHCLDISNYESTAYHLRKILDGKPLNVLINSAGICNQSLFSNTSFSKIKHEIDINLLGTISVTHAVMDSFIPNSHIITISSLMGRVAAPTYSSYCASKFGLVGFSESLRYELNLQRIKVSCLLPTLVSTDMTLDKKALNELIYPVSPEFVAAEVHNLLFKHEGLKAIGKQAELACMSERVSPFVKRFMYPTS